MAFTRAPYTSLALYGGPGLAPTIFAETSSVTDTLSVSLTESVLLTATLAVTDTVSASLSELSSIATAEVSLFRTQIGVYGGPFPYTEIGDKAVVTTFNLNVSDTLSIQWLEEPVDSNEIISGDTLRVNLVEVSALFNHVQAGDVALVQLSETISLLQSGVTLKTASDTLSVTLTEASSVGVSLDVTDTASVTVTDTSSLLTPTEAVVVSDTLSVSLTEDTPLLGVFTGILDITASDSLMVGLLESAIRADYIAPTANRPFRIRIIPRTARIRIVPQ